MISAKRLKEIERGLHDSAGILFDYEGWLNDHNADLLEIISELRELRRIKRSRKPRILQAPTELTEIEE